MKILQVGSCFSGWGGAELHVVNLSEQLATRGHDVTITCRPGQFVEREAQARGLRTAPLTVRAQQDWRAAAAYRRLFAAEQFDVVHAHWRHDYLVPAAIARLYHTPAVILSHHSPRPLKAKEALLYSRFLYNKLIALSDSVYRTLAKQGIPEEKLVTIRHGTDVASLQQTTLSPERVRLDWNVPANHFVIGIVGRLAQEKGIPDLLEAVARLDDLPVSLIIVGTGPQEAELREIVARLNLGRSVHFAGFREDVNNALAALDILVLASIWEEPCAAVVQQAMALGIPVIGTNLGGTPEMIAIEETGLLVPPHDPATLAAAIRSLLTDPERRAAMGKAGQIRAGALFTLDKMVDRIELLYREETGKQP